MARFLLDTNILVFLASPASQRHAVTGRAVEQLIQSGGKPVFSPQIIYEFWCAATRPAAANGLGWPVTDARRAIDGFRREFDVLHDPPEVLDLWLDIVAAHNLKGKRIHDAHLLATMKANGVFRLLTFNAADFPPEAGILILSPEA
jgi:predicted nucleic acid-binding protein